jgi:tRNA pseudouridine13 synthase
MTGVGGLFKETADDFLVTELPLYLPCGDGEHTYAVIEKRGITTLEAIRRISAALGVGERDVGYAGMKDARGITRQTISLPRVLPERVLGLELPGIRVLSAVRHKNKLKLGHLRGNRFRIRVRGVADDAASIAVAVLAVLEKSLGAFPPHCRTEREVLQKLVRQPDAPEKAFRAVHPRLRKLYLSAFQSHLFDRIVAERLDTLDQVFHGDVAMKHDNGACFLVTDAAAEASRAADFEISATGPMFGCRMKEPEGEPLARERRLLEEEGLTLQSFDLEGGLRMEGERRPLRVPITETAIELDESGLILEFSLPKGSYATTVLREVMKS